MLAATIKDIDKLRYPLIATPKIDGIRCIIVDGQAVSRTFKPIPNRYVRSKLEGLPPVDGELIVGNNFQDCGSGIMSYDGEPDFTYCVFDILTEQPYIQRLAYLYSLTFDSFCKKLLHEVVNDKEKLLQIEEDYLAAGYEGVMLRHPDSPYKCGRSTFNEHYLLKLKRFEDSEAEIIGFEEQMHNANSQTRDAFGLAERSSHKDGLIPMNTLGTLLVRDVKTGVEFGIGSGFTQEQRQELWLTRPLKAIVIYKFQPHGVKDKPRCPIFKGFRLD